MNAHLNIFNNYREDYGNPRENNLTRAFIITLKNEPNLLRDFFYLISDEMTWDDITVSIQDRNVDISGFETVIGLALTSQDIEDHMFQSVKETKSSTQIPDFLVYSNKTLIVGEVKKHSEMPVQQLKNQLSYLTERRTVKDKLPMIRFRSLSWTAILSRLIIPYIRHHQKTALRPLWAEEFREYLATHYTDWLPVPSLDQMDFSGDPDSVTRQLIEKRLHTIQSMTPYGAPNYWVGGRITMPLDFGWATEAQVTLLGQQDQGAVRVTIWPGDTKAQGHRLFNHDLTWIKATSLHTPDGVYPLAIYPYIKFSHVMGRWVGAVNFYNTDVAYGQRFHTTENFHLFCKTWDREEWPGLEQMLDEKLTGQPDWRDRSGWEASFRNSGRNFVYLSMGFECNITVPYRKLKTAEENDPSGKAASSILANLIASFKDLVNQGQARPV